MPIYLDPYNDLSRYAREKMLDEYGDSKIIGAAFLIGIMVGIGIGIAI